VHALKDLHQEYQRQGIHLALSNLNKRVMVTLARTGFLRKLGPEWHFVRAHDAVQVSGLLFCAYRTRVFAFHSGP
jgi:sulfate transporter 4